MNHRSIDDPNSPSSQHQLKYPVHNVIAAAPQPQVDQVVTALEDAGFMRERIEIILAKDVFGLREQIGGSGIHRVLTWIELSLGDDLDALDQAWRELKHGHVLIQVLVHGNEEKDRARKILLQHGGYAIHYFGRWTITPLDHR